MPLYESALRRSARRRALPPLTLDEEESLLRSVGHGTVSGLARAGSFLDTPGAITRDLLGGRFPATGIARSGLFSDEGRLSGRDVLEKWGLLRRNRKGLDWGDVAGFGFEVATDPLTYLTLGASAVSKAGKAMKMAGQMGKVDELAKGMKATARMTMTPEDVFKRMTPRKSPVDIARKTADGTLIPGRDIGEVAEQVLMRHGGPLKPVTSADRFRDILMPGQAAFEEAAKKLGADPLKLKKERMGGLAGFGLNPFGDPTVVMGTGRAAQAAAYGLDVAGIAAKQSLPGRLVRSVFDPSVRGKVRVEDQEVAERAYRHLQRKQAEAKMKKHQFEDMWTDAYKTFEEEFGVDARQALRQDNLDKQAWEYISSEDKFSEYLDDLHEATLDGRNQYMSAPQYEQRLTRKDADGNWLPNKSALLKGDNSTFRIMRREASAGSSAEALQKSGLDIELSDMDPTEQELGYLFDRIMRHTGERDINEALDVFIPQASASEEGRKVLQQTVRAVTDYNRQLANTLQDKGISVRRMTSEELFRPDVLPGSERNRVLFEMHATFDEEAAAGTLALMDAYTKTAARKAGLDPEDFFRRIRVREGTLEQVLDEGDAMMFQGLRDDIAPQWYSKLQQGVDGLTQKKVSLQQVKGVLSKQGVKAEEMEWADLDGLFEGRKSVGKDELEEWVSTHAMKLDEEVLGGSSGMFEVVDPEYPEELLGTGVTEAQAIRNATGVFGDTDVEGRISRGELRVQPVLHRDHASGTYRELLKDEYVESQKKEYSVGDFYDDGEYVIVDPNGEVVHNSDGIARVYNNEREAWEELDDMLREGAEYNTDEDLAEILGITPRAKKPPQYAEYASEGGDNYREILLKLPQQIHGRHEKSKVLFGFDNQYVGPHWGSEKNVVAHLRMKDRVGPNGEKILQIEEIQSDWHQAGREQGYKKQLPKEETEYLKQKISDLSKARNDIDKGAGGPDPAVALVKRLHKEGVDDDQIDVALKAFQDKVDAAKAEAETFLSPDTAVESHGWSSSTLHTEDLGSKIRNSLAGKYDSDVISAVVADGERESRIIRRAEIVDELRHVTNALSQGNAVPNAPFKNTWHELAIKRALREAAEGGYDRLVFTGGEAQIERYNLAKYLSEVSWDTSHKAPLYDGTKGARRNVTMTTKEGYDFKIGVNPDGKIVHSPGEPGWEGKALSDVVGARMASRVLQGESAGKISGDGLRVGGEGMLGFYDKMLPTSLSKYLKKYKVKAEPDALDVGAGGARGQVEDLDGNVVETFNESWAAEEHISQIMEDRPYRQYDRVPFGESRAVKQSVSPAQDGFEYSVREEIYKGGDNDAAYKWTGEEWLDAKGQPPVVDGQIVQLPEPTLRFRTESGRWQDVAPGSSFRSKEEAQRFLAESDFGIDKPARVRQDLRDMWIVEEQVSSGMQVHSVPITDAMRRDFLGKGQPLFQPGKAGSRRDLKGEYWLDGSGSARFADGDVGDFNHEGMASDHAARELIEELGGAADDEFLDENAVWNAAREALGADPDEFDLLNWREVAQKLKKEGFDIDEERLGVAMNVGDADPRLYAAKNWGWTRMAGNNLETWGLDRAKMQSIAADLPDEVDDIYSQGFDIYDHRTGKFYEQVPFDALEAGDVKALRNYTLQQRDPFGGYARGAVQFDKEGNAVITAFKGASDVSTLAHETAHIFRRHMSEISPELAEDANRAIEEMIGAPVLDDAGRWTVQAEEAFAEGFEKYLSTGEAPVESLRTVFESFREWIMQIYRGFSGTPMERQVSPELKSVFDEMLGGKVEPWSLKQGFDEKTGNFNLTVSPNKASVPIIDSTDPLAVPKHARHFPRGVDWTKKGLMEKHQHRIVATRGSLNAPRTDVTRNIPTAIVNKILVDPEVRAWPKGMANVDEMAKVIETKYAAYLDTPASVTQGSKNSHAHTLARWVNQQSKSELYNRMALQDQARYMQSGAALDASADAAHEFLHANLDEAGEVLLVDAFKNADMDVRDALAHFQKRFDLSDEAMETMGVSRGVADAVTALLKPQTNSDFGMVFGDLLDRAHDIFKTSVTVVWPAFLGRNLISGQWMNLASGHIQDYGDMVKYHKAFKYAFGELKDNQTDKAVQYLREMESFKVILPHVGVEDIPLEHVTDEFFPSKNALQSFNIPQNLREVRELRSSRVAPPEPPSLARQKLQQLKAPHGVTGRPDPLRAVSDKLNDAVARIPKPVKTGANSAATAYQTATRTGAKVNWWIEYANKAPMYVYLRDQGWDAAAAAEEVLKWQVDYSALSDIEKAYMKRIVPFYTFTRRIAPTIAERLMQKPGGLMGRTIMASGTAHGPTEMIPDYVTQNVSIPLGTDDEGNKSYITGLGLPFEDTLSFFGGQGLGGTIRQGGLEALSRTTPFIKAPLEWATNQTFFQTGPTGGRQLEDLGPTWGRIGPNIKDLVTGSKTRDVEPLGGSPGLEFFLANSPLARAGTTARKVTDPRKYQTPGTALMNFLNLTTGLQYNQVSPAAQDAIEREVTADFMKKYLRGRDFTKVYIPDEAKEQMDPLLRQKAILFERLQSTLRNRQQERQ